MMDRWPAAEVIGTVRVCWLPEGLRPSGVREPAPSHATRSASAAVAQRAKMSA
jgi:hypothetical protein